MTICQDVTSLITRHANHIGILKVSHGSMGSPVACNIRFLATALEKTLKGFTAGGTGYLKLSYLNNKKTSYYGFDSNETRKLHCYYSTNKGFGSEFLDTPKTLSVAIYCPVSMDQEIGEFSYRNTMIDGNYCRALADKEVDISVFLRPTNYKITSDLAKSKMRSVAVLIY